MTTEPTLTESIDTAADAVGSVWPLHSFVTANPLSGFEDRPFHEAVADAERVLGGDGYPSADVFRRALDDGRIGPAAVRRQLDAHGYDLDPEAALDRMATADPSGDVDAATRRVDSVLTKWLSAFLDQGGATWPMPDRERGFYDAVRALAPHDDDIPGGDFPEDPIDAIRDCLSDYPVGRWPDIFEAHLSALPGWTGFLKRRAADDDAWQSTYPITLSGYLAVRLLLTDRLDAPLAPTDEGDATGADDDRPPLPELWLTAWEDTYRGALVEEVSAASEAAADAADGDRPDAQFVFCIDTRSEIIRRHVEATGDYETHGYAGFFGVPMQYSEYGSDVTTDACPPILDPQHRITEHPTGDGAGRETHDRWHATLDAGRAAAKRLKSNAATAFSFVEGSGLGYGAALTARTLFPSRLFRALDGLADHVPDTHAFCEPSIDHEPDAGHDLPEGLTLDEKVEYAATAFELMGWEEFARVVVFAGHASRTANNPFDSSLDCGACAGNPGGPNARVLAAICNDEAVKAALRERGTDVPEDTVFVAAEHNTTTDEVEVYAAAVPESHAADIDRLRSDLATARAGAAAERAGDMGADPDSGVEETRRRAVDWAETRPEWGLAGNAGFVVGPRDLTDGLDLDGRVFLHSYDPATDPDGDALEAILTGPMVVTQWINAQYYFSTVDNAAYGSGSKVTHNPVGNVGVYQGNGGDLMTGLPMQSLMSADGEPYHQPLRLSTVVHAPVERVTDILATHGRLTELLDNDWLSLTVVDPERDHRGFHYAGELDWTPVDESMTPEPTPTPTPTAVDD